MLNSFVFNMSCSLYVLAHHFKTTLSFINFDQGALDLRSWLIL